MAHVVVLGAGLGGTIMAYAMKDALRPQDTLTVVNRGSTYSFVPSNPWVAVGWRGKEDIEVDLAPVFERRGIAFRPDGAVRVHPETNSIEMGLGDTLTYDYLVSATGPELAFDEIEGLGPQGNTHSVCHVDHALRAKDAFETLASKGGPVVIGAAQGASCFGPAYEFAFILETALRRRKVRDRVPMTFVTPEPYIGHLGLDGVGDTKSLLESALREKHIKWITNARMTKVEPGMMHVEELSADGTVAARHELPFAFSMMLPAFRGVEAVHGIAGLTNPRGFILADKHQRNPTFPNVFSIGVCVAIPPGLHDQGRLPSGSRRPSRCNTPITAPTTTVDAIPTAAAVDASPASSSENRTTPTVSVPRDHSRAETVSSLNAIRNTISAPAAAPGATAGNTT